MAKTKTIDLSTITSIPTGSNIITVKARAAGFADSNSSNSVTYNKTTTLINFGIAPNVGSFQAEEGMTWQQWVNSEYNTDNFYTTEIKVYNTAGGRVQYTDSGRAVFPTDIISETTSYVLYFEYYA